MPEPPSKPKFDWLPPLGGAVVALALGALVVARSPQPASPPRMRAKTVRVAADSRERAAPRPYRDADHHEDDHDEEDD